MIEIIRKNNPEIKILVISRIPYLFDEIDEDMKTVRKDLREFQRELVNHLRKKGDTNLHFLDGSKLLGEDYHEFTVDTVHPNDLGFMEFAKNLKKEINLIMKTGEN